MFSLCRLRPVLLMVGVPTTAVLRAGAAGPEHPFKLIVWSNGSDYQRAGWHGRCPPRSFTSSADGHKAGLCQAEQI